MKLTVATVVRNDLKGLVRTIDSIRRILTVDVEYVVVDGSDDLRVKAYLVENGAGIRWISEADNGIYDAMNKALSLANGDYALFINAGDTIHPDFNPRMFFNHVYSADEILLGRVVEVVGEDRYLCPGVGREELVFEAPRHQATFYPRKYYSAARYAAEMKIGADGLYTRSGIAAVGAAFIPVSVAEFYVGGVSSTYGKWRTVKQRLLEATTFRNRAKVLAKVVMWRLLPRRLFYRILAWRKYTKLMPGQETRGNINVIRRPAESDRATG